jgi:hypothetical protein
MHQINSLLVYSLLARAATALPADTKVGGLRGTRSTTPVDSFPVLAYQRCPEETDGSFQASQSQPQIYLSIPKH